MSPQCATILAAFMLAGCTDDFDALFARPADAGTPADAEAGAIDASADVSKVDAAGSCTTGAATCSCEGARTCNSSCDVDGECTATATSDSKLSYECREHVDRCSVDCNHADCDFRCDAEGTCSMTCGDDATCVLRCTGRPTSCELTCGEGVKKDCGAGVFTCGETCP